MKISKRTGTALFFVALFSSFIMQYPLFKYHAGNWDHYFIMFLSNTISKTGSAPWIANWSSYFGLHKISYPQGVPFLISFFQQLSGEHSDSLILVYSYIEGAMAVVFSFALGLVIRKKDYLFAFFLSFLFATSPSYLYVSQWTASARGLFITLLPIFVMLNLFIFNRKISKRSVVFLNMFFFILLFSIHRMAFFVLITAIPATILTYYLAENAISFDYFSKIWHSIGKTKRNLIGLGIAVVFIYIIYWYYSQYMLSSVLTYSYTKGRFFSGNNLYVRILNLSLTFISSGGILTIFILFPLYWVFRDKKANREVMYTLFFLMFSFSFVFFPAYFRTYASLVLASFIALFMVFLMYNRHGIHTWKFKIDRKDIVILLVISLLFSGFMQARWDGNLSSTQGKQWMDYGQEEVVDTVRVMEAGPIFVSSGDINRFVSLYGGQVSMSPGFHYYYAYIVYGFITSNSLNITFSPKISWSGEIYLYNENFNSDFKTINGRYHNLSEYDYFEIADQGNYTNHLSNKKLNMFENYKIYDSGRYSIFLVDKTNTVVEKTKLFF